jgi:16S rRNA (cytosine967-C5)-methyltransferase
VSKDPRDIAVWALSDRQGYVTKRLHALLNSNDLSEQDKSLAREVALGTCRRRATVRAVLHAYMQDPSRPLPGALNEILDIAGYQLLFLDRVPDHAVVNEAVNQTIRHRHRRKSGLVNGVLRTITREVSEVIEGPPPVEANVIPVRPDAFRRSERKVFPDPASDAAGYLAAAQSLPQALARRWLTNLGSLAAAGEVAMHANVRAPLILRVNRLRGTVDDALRALAEESVEAVAHRNGQSVVVLDRGAPGGLKAFREGLLQVQDASAMAVVEAAEPRPGMRVLDFCAAPGTKTTHLAERMDNRGEIVAVDVSDEKLARVRENCERMGVPIVTTCPAEQAGGLKPGSFDLVLADVPCSNTGVLARRAEARWRFSDEALARVVKDQRTILALAATFVAPGGRLVYSTCSIEPEECSQAVEAFLAATTGFELVREKLMMPGGATDPAAWHDGGYYALLSR